MNFWWILVVICLVFMLIFGIYGYFKDKMVFVYIAVGIVTILTALLPVCIANTIKVKKESIRQTQERNQIEYQIEHLSNDKDKIKLNEWILTYNDWVNDVNTSKELYGVFSWYYNFDMSQHTIIDLV